MGLFKPGRQISSPAGLHHTSRLNHRKIEKYVIHKELLYTYNLGEFCIGTGKDKEVVWHHFYNTEC